MGSPTTSQFADRPNVTLNVTLPGQAANCVPGDGRLDGNSGGTSVPAEIQVERQMERPVRAF
jgi:hypothetical protein